MAWIEVIPPDDASGELEQQYEVAIRRAGKIWNIVSIMSQNHAAMKASMELYIAIMIGPSKLSRSRREMLAVIVSAQNQCVY